VSELLDRIQREIRERLEVSRAAVRKHERLEAALRALGDARSRATRVVGGRGEGSPAAGSPSRSSRTGTPPGARGRSSRQPSAASRAAKRVPAARAGGRDGRARRSAGGRARPAAAGKGPEARAAAATPARKRAPRGANRQAVLQVIGERPGVTAPELAAASRVTGGTLYSLLRRLTDEGTVEKRELPGAQTGYALAPSAGAAARSSDTKPEASTTEATSAAESRTAGAA
jgi:hypothetical protein